MDLPSGFTLKQKISLVRALYLTNRIGIEDATEHLAGLGFGRLADQRLVLAAPMDPRVAFLYAGITVSESFIAEMVRQAGLR